MKDTKQIIKKWYKELGFLSKYNKEFLSLLDSIDLLDLTTFDKYDYTTNSPQKNLLACLYFAEQLEKEYVAKDIPKNILIDTLQDLVLWNDTFYSVNGKMGLSEFPWLDRTFLMQIFRIGRLQFSLYPSELDIKEIGIKKGQPVLEVHIPSGAPLIFQDCEKSFDNAKALFSEKLPDFNKDFCICHSWLLDDSLLPLLGENSNVAKFQTFFTPVSKNLSDSVLRYTFLWNTTRECIKDVEAKSGFAKRLKEKILSDNMPLYEVLGIRKF